MLNLFIPALVSVLVSGAPVEEDAYNCPKLPCYFTPCSNPITTYYMHNGHNCTGCSVCPRHSTKRQLDLQGGANIVVECPMVDCMFPSSCRGPLHYTTIHIGEKQCTGCPYCPQHTIGHGFVDTAISSDVEEKRNIQFGNGCPIVECMNPGLCDVPYNYHTFHVNSQECLGCPTCPSRTGGIQIKLPRSFLQPYLSFERLCPIMDCIQAIPCKVPLEYTPMVINGRACQGCPRCPIEQSTLPSSDSKTTSVRQLESLLNVCPVVDCMYVGRCDVPRTQTMLDMNGHKCPGCMVCPNGHLSTDTYVLQPLSNSKRQLTVIPFHRCPMTMCAQPTSNCSQPLQLSTFQFQGMTCDGCMFCPADNV